MSLLSDSERTAAEQATAGTVIPEGVYACRVTAVERYKSGASLVWKFSVASGEFAGKELWDWTGLGETAIYRTKARFAALGVALDADEAVIEGIPCQVTVEIGRNEATGEPKNKVVAVQRSAGATGPGRGSGQLPTTPSAVAAEDADIDAAFGGGSEGGLL